MINAMIFQTILNGMYFNSYTNRKNNNVLEINKSNINQKTSIQQNIDTVSFTNVSVDDINKFLRQTQNVNNIETIMLSKVKVDKKCTDIINSFYTRLLNTNRNIKFKKVIIYKDENEEIETNTFNEKLQIEIIIFKEKALEDSINQDLVNQALDMINSLMGSGFDGNIAISSQSNSKNKKGKEDDNNILSIDKRKIPDGLRGISEHLEKMDPENAKQFLPMLKKACDEKKPMGDNKGDEKNMDRLRVAGSLPLFLSPRFLDKSSKHYLKNKKTLEALFKKVLDCIIVGYADIKRKIIEDFINYCTVGIDIFPKSPIAIFGPPGIGKSLMNQGVGAVIACIHLLLEFRDFGKIFWTDIEKNSENFLDLSDKAIEELVTHSTKYKFLRRFCATINLQEIKDINSLSGFNGAYAGSSYGEIIKALMFDPALPIATLSEEDQRIYYNPDKTVREPLTKSLNPDEIDKFGVAVNGGSNVDNPSNYFLGIGNDKRQHLDLFLNVPLCLERIYFVFSGNTKEKISDPMFNRLTSFDLSGYSPEEKKQLLLVLLSKPSLEGISFEYVKTKAILISDALVNYIVELFGTSALGIRILQRVVANMINNASREFEATKKQIVISKENLLNYIDNEYLHYIKKSSMAQISNNSPLCQFVSYDNNTELSLFTLMYAPAGISGNNHKYTLLFHIDKKDERTTSMYQIMANFNTRMATIIESILSLLGMSANFFKQFFNSVNHVIEILQTNRPINPENIDDVILPSILLVFAYAKKKQISKGVIFSLIKLTVQGGIIGIGTQLIEKLKYSISHYKENIKVIFISTADKPFINMLQKILNENNLGKQVTIKPVDTISEVLNECFEEKIV